MEKIDQFSKAEVGNVMKRGEDLALVLEKKENQIKVFWTPFMFTHTMSASTFNGYYFENTGRNGVVAINFVD